jgi:hypothetical protein
MMDKERLYSLLNNKSHKCYSTENLILDTKLVKELNGIIRKLNDEVDVLVEKVDALTKQKIYLQSKLREKHRTNFAPEENLKKVGN